MSVPWGVYVALSAVMFLEYAVWGTWMPVLAARLLGPLKMSGKQTGWIYATLPIGCLLAPLLAGPLADKWVDPKYILAACHLAGMVLLVLAVRQRSFGGMFLVMLLYSLCYGATLPLVNAVLFTHVKDGYTQSLVFIWAPVAWALIGYALSGWRVWRGGEGEGGDCLVFGAILSVVMAGSCLFLPEKPQGGEAEAPLEKALAMLQQTDFLVFLLTSLVIAGLMQFYFLASARFMMDRGISAKAVPATMGLAQAAQAVATFFALGFVLDQLGFKQTLVTGAGCWVVLYLAYILGRPRGLIVVSQAFHGLAFVLFMIVGQVYASKVAPPEIVGSVQSLIFAATMGLGPFLGVQLAGVVMDQFSEKGKMQWQKFWAVPLVITVVALLIMATVFQGTIVRE